MTFEAVSEKIDTLDVFQIVYEDLAPIEKYAVEFSKYKNILVFGTGGSSLGAKALIEFKSLFKGIPSKVHFLENVDSRSFINTVSKSDKDDTGVIVISKSGKTSETLMLFLTLIQMWPNFDYKNRALAITRDSEDNDLRSIAIDKGMKIIDHNPNIGGRFSVFSVVGLLPALLGGVDVKLLIKGAQRAIFEKEKIFQGIEKVAELIRNGVNEHVVFSYSDFMFGFGKWMIQLFSENLGKRSDFGITVVNATGTIDQHSMLQLFLGGPSNRYYTVIIQKNNVITEKVKANNELNGHNIHELMLAHQRATIESLKEKAHVRVFEFEELSEEAIGYMMMLSFIETVGIADIFEVNPFDQPAVEASKKLAMKYLNEKN